MDSLIAKLSTYDLVNNVIVGTVIYYVGTHCLDIKILENLSMIGELSIVYFVGLVTSRIGSLLLEPICKFLKIVVYAPPEQYYVAERKDKKISTIVEVNNMYRSFSAGFLIILLTKFITNNWGAVIESLNKENILLWCLVIGFILAFRKQTAYVKSRVEAALRIDDTNIDRKG